MSTIAVVPSEQRLVLSAVDWATYDRLLHDLDGHHLRLTYDRGDLEIMTVSAGREMGKKLLARLLEALTEELDIAVLGLGNTTMRREDLARGLEPDECWYIAHEAEMRSKTEVDLSSDPPPDLVIEVEVSRSVLDRLAIYSKLGVPEVWRYHGEQLTVLALGPDRRYAEADTSPSFPRLPLAELARFLGRRGQVDETSLVKSFRAWVRATLV